MLLFPCFWRTLERLDPSRADLVGPVWWFPIDANQKRWCSYRHAHPFRPKEEKKTKQKTNKHTSSNITILAANASRFVSTHTKKKKEIFKYQTGKKKMFFFFFFFCQILLGILIHLDSQFIFFSRSTSTASLCGLQRRDSLSQDGRLSFIPHIATAAIQKSSNLPQSLHSFTEFSYSKTLLFIRVPPPKKKKNIFSKCPTMFK